MNWRPVVLVILLIVLAGAIVYSLRKGPPPPEGYQLEQREVSEPVPGAPAETEQAPVALAKIRRVEKSLEQEEVFIYDSTKLRNPMTRFLTELDKQARVPRGTGFRIDHRIDGIIWSSTNPLAIIDGNVTGVGDSLRDGSLVTEIGRNYVALKRAGKKFRLTLE